MKSGIHSIMSDQELFFISCSDFINDLSKKPDIFLNTNETTSLEIKSRLKTLYDFAKKQEIKSLCSSALPELIIKNFDLEQIWQQIELQNDSILTNSIINVSNSIVNKKKLFFKNLEKVADSSTGSNNEDVGEKSEISSDLEQKSDSENSKSNYLNEDELHSNSSYSAEDNEKDGSKPYNKSDVDDDFFKLHEMEEFLNAEEKKGTDLDSGNSSEESDEDNESVDLFKDEGEEQTDDVRLAKYKDYFVKTDEVKQQKRNKFFEELDNFVEEVDAKSTFELRKDRLSKKIAEIEDDKVGEKPWQLKGEITAENRPQNSLLEDLVEFDMTSRPAPVITEQTSFQLEDIIRQRIKDKVFDSVERKAKPINTPLEYKKKLVLDQEKSKASLAQIYEKDFLEQQAVLDPDNDLKQAEEPLLHKEVKKMMQTLFNQLDALSNFHFTPKPAIPELKIVSNLPAISMEEVAPVATSDATLLAPEEIRSKPKSDILGNSERTSTDKNRARRKRKLKQKHHAKEKEKRQKLSENLKSGHSNNLNKDKTKQHTEKLIKDKNIEKMNETNGKQSIKSSSAFFTQLQEQVQTQIKSKLQTKKPKSKNTLIAKKFKL